MAKIRKALLAGATAAAGVFVGAVVTSIQQGQGLSGTLVVSAAGAGLAAGLTAGWAAWRVPNTAA